MIEIGEYKIFYEGPDFSDLERSQITNEVYTERHQSRVEEVTSYLETLAEAYDESGARGGAMLKVDADPTTYEIKISCTTGFKNHLDEQEKPDFLKSVEAASGMQYVILAGFVSSPQSSNISRYGSGQPMLSRDFWRVAHGVPAGKVLTEAENVARTEMNDRVFEKLSAALKAYKERKPDLIVELEEKTLGTFFLRVTTEENKEYGITAYSFNSAVMANLLDDKDDIEAVLAGPPLFPTEVERLRTPKEQPQSQPPKREPKKLDL